MEEKRCERREEKSISKKIMREKERREEKENEMHNTEIQRDKQQPAPVAEQPSVCEGRGDAGRVSGPDVCGDSRKEKERGI